MGVQATGPRYCVLDNHVLDWMLARLLIVFPFPVKNSLKLIAKFFEMKVLFVDKFERENM